MIDEQWLSELRFDMPGTGAVTGLAGVGSQFVVLKYTAEDGSEMVVKSFRRALPWHLKEVPRDLGWTAGHSIDRVNRKLLAAAGSPIIDENCWTYNSVFNLVLRHLLTRGASTSVCRWTRPDARTRSLISFRRTYLPDACRTCQPVPDNSSSLGESNASGKSFRPTHLSALWKS